MERERGRVRINHGAGAIDTDTPPSPVKFAPSSFPGIVDNMVVFFQRVAPGSDWATQVVPASGVESLAALAMLGSGFTKKGRAMVVDDALRSVAEAQVAPTAALARAHLASAEERMSAIAALKNPAGTPVGVAAIRKLLGTFGRSAG
jgi:hypothetical protein